MEKKDKSILREYVRGMDIDQVKSELESDGIDTDSFLKKAKGMVDAFNKSNVHPINPPKEVEEKPYKDNSEKIRVNDK